MKKYYKKSDHRSPCRAADFKARRDNFLADLKVAGFDLLLQDKPGFASHDIFGLVDMCKKVRTLAGHKRLVKGDKRYIFRNPYLQRGEKVMQIGAGRRFRSNECGNLFLKDEA